MDGEPEINIASADQLLASVRDVSRKLRRDVEGTGLRRVTITADTNDGGEVTIGYERDRGAYVEVDDEIVEYGDRWG